MKILYLYDIYCGWCNVAKPIVIQIHKNYTNKGIEFVPINYNLFDKNYHLEINEKFLSMVRQVGWTISPKRTGQKFSEKYFNLLQSKNFSHDSTLSSIACATVKILDKQQLFPYILALQSALFDKGLDLNQIGTLAKIANKQLKLTDDSFIKTFNSPKTLEVLNTDKQLVYSLLWKNNVKGIPTMLIDTNGKQSVIDIYNYRP